MNLRPHYCLTALLWFSVLDSVALADVAPTAPRAERSLNGVWLFQRDGASDKDWKEVRLPCSFQSHEGNEFHGVGVYKKAIEALDVPKGQRILLHFQAAATLAEVSWNGEKLGTHLGGWTPFRFDVTDLIRKWPVTKPHELRVRVDEKVGHNTQGFLPIVAPHFGGIWQDVKLVVVPEAYINDLQVQAIGDLDSGTLKLKLPVISHLPGKIAKVEVLHRLRGRKEFTKTLVAGEALQHETLAIPVSDVQAWSPTQPHLYDIEARLFWADQEAPIDVVATRAAFRKIETKGQQLLLNGKPLGIRGLLNWGYAPPLVTPATDERWMVNEIQSARDLGFNLMKFCLWIPPKRYLELADEMGMLAWMEYPTWHPDLTKKHLQELTSEFAEFFAYDRNHASVVLRSLTCETGPTAELAVIRNLYDLAHQMVPGSIVEDDSSWIGWNRVHDFYDDHPYGNNHTWVNTLQGLREHIAKHGAKPLVLGEAIAADTWVNPQSLLQGLGADRPFWLPGFVDDNQRWLDRMRKIAKLDQEGLRALESDSLRYALAMRKYQIETFRREVPQGGYVVSVIRDFPLAGMGLMDYRGHLKWAPSQWSWQRDTLCILKTANDRRSFAAGEKFEAEVLISHFGAEALKDGELSVSVGGDDLNNPIAKTPKTGLALEPGTLRKVLDLQVPVPEAGKPWPLIVRADLQGSTGHFTNEWTIWIMPTLTPKNWTSASLHYSCEPALAQDLFPSARILSDKDNPKVVVARKLDDHLLNYLEAGGRVLLMPDGQAHSLPLASHWFLRGAPFVADHPLVQLRLPHAMLVDLQHFDLAADVIPDLPYLEQIDPILMLWDNHDIKQVKTHGLLFETKVGKGRLLVSALRHTGSTNAAGRWLLDVLLQHLEAGPEPRHALTEEARKHMREKLHEQKIDLVQSVWRFKPDPQGEGLKNNWHLPTTQLDDSWKPIRIAKHWEAQGYPDLDGWAWYRLSVEVPKDWKGREVYLNFEGVDDYYELFVNGKEAGKGGDLAKRITAFDLRQSHRITALVQPGDQCHIAVRVNDFQGAGGIHRPVTMSTMALAPELDILR